MGDSKFPRERVVSLSGGPLVMKEYAAVAVTRLAMHEGYGRTTTEALFAAAFSAASHGRWLGRERVPRRGRA